MWAKNEGEPRHSYGAQTYWKERKKKAVHAGTDSKRSRIPVGKTIERERKREEYNQCSEWRCLTGNDNVQRKESEGEAGRRLPTVWKFLGLEYGKDRKGPGAPIKRWEVGGGGIVHWVDNKKWPFKL